MNTATVLLMVLLGAATALCGVAAWGVFELVKTARSLRLLADDLQVRVIPFIDKADVTIDAVNVELLRIDEFVTRVEEVTDRVSSTSRTVQEVANAPAEIVSDIAERVRRAWRTRRQPSTGTQSGAAGGQQSDTSPRS